MLAMQLNIALRKGATSIFSAASADVNCVNSVLCVKIQFKIVGGSNAQTVAQVVWLEYEYTGPGRRTLNTNRFSDPTDDRNYGLNPRCISWKTWSYRTTSSLVGDVRLGPSTYKQRGEITT